MPARNTRDACWFACLFMTMTDDSSKGTVFSHGAFSVFHTCPWSLSSAHQQCHRHIIDISAGRTGHDQAIRCLQGMVGIIVRKHGIQIQA